MSSKQNLIDELIKNNNISGDNIRLVGQVASEMYDTIKDYSGDVINYDYFEENIIQDDRVKHLFPYICYFPPIIENNFKQIPQLADGNCLFHSLSTALDRNQAIIRQEICDFMISNENFSRLPVIIRLLAGEGNGRMTIKQYIQTEKLYDDKSYGGIIETIAAMILYESPIYIYQMKVLINVKIIY